TGHELIRQGIGLGLTGIALIWLLIRRSTKAVAAVAGAAAVTMLFHAMAGHAASSGKYAWFDVGVQWLHLMAVGVGGGGPVWLLACTGGRERAEPAVAVNRLPSLAGIALGGVTRPGGQRALP